jgi:hypothetical protein
MPVAVIEKQSAERLASLGAKDRWARDIGRSLFRDRRRCFLWCSCRFLSTCVQSGVSARSRKCNPMRLMHRVFPDDDDMARIRRGAVVALARNPFAAGASQFVVVRLIGMLLAHPSNAATNRATALHWTTCIRLSRTRPFQQLHALLLSQRLPMFLGHKPNCNLDRATGWLGHLDGLRSTKAGGAFRRRRPRDAREICNKVARPDQANVVSSPASTPCR